MDSIQEHLTVTKSARGLAISNMAETSSRSPPDIGEVGNNEGKQKTSPPESPAVTGTRSWIIFAFWAIVACLGLPHWIWTTSIHRSDLPLDIMNSWADGQVGLPFRL